MQRPNGFTLVELMVALVILGGVLLLIPANLEGFGARSRLQNAANTFDADSRPDKVLAQLHRVVLFQQKRTPVVTG